MRRVRDRVVPVGFGDVVGLQHGLGPQPAGCEGHRGRTVGRQLVRQRERHPVHRRLGQVVEEGDPVVGGVVLVGPVRHLDDQSSRCPDQERERVMAGDRVGVDRQAQRVQPLVEGGLPGFPAISPTVQRDCDEVASWSFRKTVLCAKTGRCGRIPAPSNRCPGRARWYARMGERRGSPAGSEGRQRVPDGDGWGSRRRGDPQPARLRPARQPGSDRLSELVLQPALDCGGRRTAQLFLAHGAWGSSATPRRVAAVGASPS